MDFKKLLLSWEGRISRQPYWIAVAIIFGSSFVANFIPILGILVQLGLIYVQVCVYSKRLHDLGLSGWIQAISYAATLVLAVVGVVMVVPAMMAVSGGPGDQTAMMAALTSSIPALFVLALAVLVGLGFTLWLGIAQGQPGANRYGPSPLSPAGDPAVFE